MATSPTSKSALQSGAAKDDSVGLNGDFTFTIADLLANDPGGAAKVNTGTQFFFGETAADRESQAAYLEAHGITDNGDGSYTLSANAIDFKYFVQIGNKGTWSQADVEVTAPEGQLGDNLFKENFDGYEGSVFQASGDFWQSTNLNTASGWTGATAGGSELGSNGYLSVETTSGDGDEAFWLDTQNSIGPIDLSHTFTDDTGAVGGVTSVLSFDIAKQDEGPYVTNPDAAFEFRIDGVTVAHIDAKDLVNAGQMYHYDIDIAGYAAAGADHTIQLIDVTEQSSYNGFSIDSIQINDWVI